MMYFFVTCLFVFAVLGFYFTLQYLWIEDKKYLENRMLALFCFASALWSTGFGLQILQRDADTAYLCRVVGMVGTILYLIVAQVLVCYVAEIPAPWSKVFNGIAYTGIIVYFFSIEKEQIVYEWSESRGMTYYFKAGFGNNVYTLYCVVLALIFLAESIYMIYFSKVKRTQRFGRQFVRTGIWIIVGMVLDTVVPLLGIPAIPGSTMTQFLGMAVVRAAIHETNRSRVNLRNLSEFMYYSLSVPVLVYDIKQEIQIVNDAAVDFFAIERERVIEDNVKVSQLFDVDADHVFNFDGSRSDMDVVCRGNNVYCSLAVNKIHDHYGDEIGYIIIVTDLTERMKTMQELEEAIKTADAANRAKSIFLANMSHEIRTPMNVIVGFSELLIKMQIPQEARERVQDIKDSSENLLAIINDLLDISKIESGKMELVCSEYYTASLFKDVYLIINAQAKRKGLHFRMSIAPDMPSRFYGDKVRIRGVLINLLNNAVKYTNEGSVTLEASVRDVYGKNACIQFKVADTGIGIKEEEQDRLFESFSQVDRKVHQGVEGTGLGLAIVKGYVTLMNGDVTVDSEYGVGSVFTAYIEQEIIDAAPMDSFMDEGEQRLDDFQIGPMKISGMRVLVVDDNQINLKVASSTLGYYGLDVDVASGGREAIDLCKMHRYPLVFMDQMMPEMNGVDAMKRIRELDSYYAPGGTAKIIVLTANAVAGARQQLMSEGFDEYLGKPMNFKQLERLFVQFVPEEQIYISSEEEQGGESKEQKELRELGEMLPMADVQQGIMFCGGRMTDYLSILRVTYRNGEKTLKELEELQQSADYENYTIKIHGLKSTSLSIGAKFVSEMAKEQELAGKAKEYAFIDAHLEDFEREYRALLAQIREVLAHYRMLEDEPEQKEILEKEADIAQLYRSIIQCMDGYDFAGVSQLLREAQKKEYTEQEKKDIEQLKKWMDELEEERIREFITSRVKE